MIEYGHLHYGENKVQEALEKWSDIKLTKKDLKLHLIGKLQTNKVKQAIKIFDYIHSVDSEKLAKKIADEEIKQGKKIKIFIQVNIGDEEQKSGEEIGIDNWMICDEWMNHDGWMACDESMTCDEWRSSYEWTNYDEWITRHKWKTCEWHVMSQEAYIFLVTHFIIKAIGGYFIILNWIGTF